MGTKRKASALSSSSTTTATIDPHATTFTTPSVATTQLPQEPPRKNRRQSPPYKLPRLPKNASITKRPLLHPPIPSPHTGPTSQKVVYISTRTPFHSAVKRVETLFRKIELRERQSSLHRRHGHGKKGVGRLTEDVNSSNAGKLGEDPILKQALAELDYEGRLGKKTGAGVNGEEVFVKATGRAIEKALNVAMWFQKNDSGVKYRVRLKTGTLSAIDDVEITSIPKKGKKKRVWDVAEVEETAGNEEAEIETVDEEKEDGKDGVVEAGMGDRPETRIRQTNMLEIAISLVR